jgi:hypothetical protein
MAPRPMSQEKNVNSCHNGIVTAQSGRNIQCNINNYIRATVSRIQRMKREK